MKKYFLSILLFGFPFLITSKEEPSQNSIDRSILNQLLTQSTNPSLTDEETPGKIYTFTGNFKLPKGESSVPRIYYKGQIIPTDGQGFVFSQTKKPGSLTIVCALPPAPTKNTFEEMIIPSQTPCRIYTLQRQNSSTSGQETWAINVIEGDGGYTVPHEALLLLLDPSLLEKIEVKPWDKTSMTVSLSTFVIKNLEKNLIPTYRQSILASLDWDVFHKKPDIEEKKHQENHFIRKERA